MGLWRDLFACYFGWGAGGVGKNGKGSFWLTRNFRPNRSTVHVALAVKMMPKVALRALIRSIWDLRVKIFW